MSDAVCGSHPAPFVHQHIDCQRDKMIVDVKHAIQDCKYNELKGLVGNDRALLLDLLNNHLIPKHLEHSTHITFLSSLLCYAIICGDKEIVERLLSYDDIPKHFVQFLLQSDVIDKTASCLTESDVSFKIEEDAFHKGTNATNIPQYRNIPCILMCAAAQGHTIIVEQLINTPELFDPSNAMLLADSLLMSIDNEHTDVVRILSNKVDTNTLHGLLFHNIKAKNAGAIKTLIEGMDIDKLSGVLIHAIRIEDTNFIRMLFDAVNFDKLDRALIHAISINDAGLIKNLFHGIHLDRLVHAIIIEDTDFTRKLLNEMGLIKISRLLIDHIGINNVVIAKTFANNLSEDQLSDVLVKFVQHIDAASSLMREIDIDRLYAALSIIIEKNELKTAEKLLSVMYSHKLCEMLNRGLARGMSPPQRTLIKLIEHEKLYELLNLYFEKEGISPLAEEESDLLFTLIAEAIKRSPVNVFSYALTNKNTTLLHLLITCTESINVFLIPAIIEGRNDVAIPLINFLTLNPDDLSLTPDDLSKIPPNDLTDALMVAIMNDRHEVALALPRAIAQARSNISGELSRDDLILIENAQKGYKELLMGFFDSLIKSKKSSWGHLLGCAAKHGSKDAVLVLLSEPPKTSLTDAIAAIKQASEHDHDDIAKLIFDRYRPQLKLMHWQELMGQFMEKAAQNGRETVVQDLLVNIDVSLAPIIPPSLVLAAKNDHINIVRGFISFIKSQKWSPWNTGAARAKKATAAAAAANNCLKKQMIGAMSEAVEHLAAHGQAIVLQELIDSIQSLDPSVWQDVMGKAIGHAAKNGHAVIIRDLFHKIDDYVKRFGVDEKDISQMQEEWTRIIIPSLKLAVEHGHISIVPAFIDFIRSNNSGLWNKVAAHGKKAKAAAADTRLKYDMMIRAISDAVGQAAANGHAAIVQELIDFTKSLDPSDWQVIVGQAVEKASQHGHTEIVKKWLLSSAPIHPRAIDKALIEAAKHARIEAMNMLVKSRRFSIESFADHLDNIFHNNAPQILQQLLITIGTYKTSMLYEIITHTRKISGMQILQLLVRDPILGKFLGFAILQNNSDIVTFCINHIHFDEMDPEDLGDALIEDMKTPLNNNALINKLIETGAFHKIDGARAGFALRQAIESNNRYAAQHLVTQQNISMDELNSLYLDAMSTPQIKESVIDVMHKALDHAVAAGRTTDQQTLNSFIQSLQSVEGGAAAHAHAE